MLVIVEYSGRQYILNNADTFYVDKIVGKPKEEIILDKVLLCDQQVGKPYVEGVKVVCEVVKSGKQDKLLIIKHISQKHHTKRQGHRQPYTKLLVKEIKHG